MMQIDEKLRLLQPVLGKRKVIGLRQLYFLEDDYREKKEIENHIDLLLSRLVKKEIDDEIILAPPEEEICRGDIEIGSVEYLKRQLHPFHLRQSDINRHVGLFGSTGSGKTTFAMNLMRKLHKRGIPFLVFDWEKSWRSLIQDLPDVQVFTIGRDIHPLFLNFLRVPPDIDYREYIKSIISIMSEDYIGGIGADTMLLQYMEMAFHETWEPIFENLKPPDLREINRDKGKRGRRSGWSGSWKETA